MTRCADSRRPAGFGTRFAVSSDLWPGMTVASTGDRTQALSTPWTDRLAQRYFRAASKPIRVAWQFAAGGDLALPEVEDLACVDTYHQLVCRQATGAAESTPLFRHCRRSRPGRPANSTDAPAMMLRAVNAGRQRERAPETNQTLRPLRGRVELRRFSYWMFPSLSTV